MGIYYSLNNVIYRDASMVIFYVDSDFLSQKKHLLANG